MDLVELSVENSFCLWRALGLLCRERRTGIKSDRGPGLDRRHLIDVRLPNERDRCLGLSRDQKRADSDEPAAHRQNEQSVNWSQDGMKRCSTITIAKH